MRARGLALVRDLAARGLLTWDNGMPRLRVSSDFAEIVRQDRRTIDAVLRRVAVFAQQLATASLDPFVRLRDPKWTEAGCPSCGATVREGEMRCELCAVAVDLALDMRPRTVTTRPRPHKT